MKMVTSLKNGGGCSKIVAGNTSFFEIIKTIHSFSSRCVYLEAFSQYVCPLTVTSRSAVLLNKFCKSQMVKMALLNFLIRSPKGNFEKFFIQDIVKDLPVLSA